MVSPLRYQKSRYSPYTKSGSVETGEPPESLNFKSRIIREAWSAEPPGVGKGLLLRVALIAKLGLQNVGVVYQCCVAADVPQVQNPTA
jgi:hypothetical protein